MSPSSIIDLGRKVSENMEHISKQEAHFALCAVQIGLQYNISKYRLMIRNYLFVITPKSPHSLGLKLEIFLLIFIVQYASKMYIVLP